jgi:hypothetical protein
MKLFHLALVLAAAGALSGCTSMNLFKDDGASQQASKPDLSPDLDATVDEPMVSATPPGVLSAAQIRKALSGKSWKWTGSKFNGVTLYADDGSSLIEVTGKGTTTGKWQAKDGQLCESVAPAPFLPNGQPMTCRPMSGSGSTYKVGQATFTLA